MPMRFLDLVVRLGGRPSWTRGFLAYRMLQAVMVAERGRRVTP
jgi:hypothetical protein